MLRFNILLLILLCISTQLTLAQISPLAANTQPEWEAAIQALEGEGVTITSINVDCGTDAFGTYTKTNPADLIALGFENFMDFEDDSGFVLCTGNVDDIDKPADGPTSGSSPIGSAPIDNDLSVLIGPNQEDVCVVTFTVIPLGEDLEFNYVFASEEYPQYVCDNFNDAFGFFISGDGISGPYSNGAENIALVPTDASFTNFTNTPVSINSINNGNNSGACTTPNGDNCPCNQNFFIQNYGSTNHYNNYIVYNGFTTRMTAKQTVVPCKEYTIKMVIADKTDGNLDSAVFIEAGSLTTKTIDIETIGGANVNNTTADNSAIEDCANQELILNYNFDVNAGEIANLYLTLLGDTDNADFFQNEIPTVIPIAAGQTSSTIDIIPFADGIVEGQETLIIQIDSIVIDACTFNINLLDTIYIDDKQPGILTVFNSSVPLGDVIDGCENQPLLVGSATPDNAKSYNWFTNSTGSLTFSAATPSTNSFVSVTVDTSMMLYCDIEIVDGCFATDSVFIDLSIPEPTNQYGVCAGSTITLEVDGLNPTKQSVSSWGTANLSQLTINGNTADFTAPLTGGTYTYEVEINDNCTPPSVADDYIQIITVEVGNQFLDRSITEIFKCPNLPVDITVSGGIDGLYTYLFNGIQIASSAGSTYAFNEPSTGTLQVIAPGGTNCLDTVEIEIKEKANFANAGQDASGCYIVSHQLGTPAINGYTYAWIPSYGFVDDKVAQPLVTVDTLLGGLPNAQTYTVIVTDPEGCEFKDQVTVTATIGPDVTPTIFGINPVQIGETTTLSATGSNVSTYDWESATGYGLEQTTGQMVTVRPTSIADTLFYVTGTEASGCTKTESITIEVIAPPTLELPSAFSPNLDGINDYLLPVVVDVDHVVKYEVYNRWGKKVYEGGTLTTGWNGKNLDGEPQPIGVYVWIIEYQENGKNDTKVQTGSVTLIR